MHRIRINLKALIDQNVLLFFSSFFTFFQSAMHLTILLNDWPTVQTQRKVWKITFLGPIHIGTSLNPLSLLSVDAEFRQMPCSHVNITEEINWSGCVRSSTKVRFVSYTAIGHPSHPTKDSRWYFFFSVVSSDSSSRKKLDRIYRSGTRTANEKKDKLCLKRK